MVQRKKKNQKRKGEQDYEKDDGNENEQGDDSKGSKTDSGSSRYDSFDDNDGICRHSRNDDNTSKGKLPERHEPRSGGCLHGCDENEMDGGSVENRVSDRY